MEGIVTLENIYGISLTGKRDHNEDLLLAIAVEDGYLLAVADGVGGQPAGEVAANIAIKTLKKVFIQEYRTGMDGTEVSAILKIAYQEAHNAITHCAVGKREGMSTTLISAFVAYHGVLIANSGDCRAYILGDEIRFKTRDHSYVQKLVERNLIDDKAAKNHPMQNIITHCLGGRFAVDLYDIVLWEGEVLLICSDGVSDYVNESTLLEAVQKRSSEHIARFIMDKAMETSTDNATVIVYAPK
jgi:serine/threonine protein phosphatase PrpC